MKTRNAPIPSAIRGFTLVEMMVVIIIVITLAILAFGMTSKMRDKANNTLAIANMRQIGIGIASHLSDQGRLPRFAGAGVNPTYSTQSKHARTQAMLLQPYLGLAEPTAKDQYAEVLRPPGLKSGNMSGKKNWYEVTAYAMYSTNDIHKSKAYFPKGVVTDSAQRDVGPFGRNGGNTSDNPTTEGWTAGMFDRALAKYSTDNSGKLADLSMVPAMLEINAKYPGIKGAWPWPVPQEPVRKDHVNVLYFDWHVGSVKPDYFYKP